MSEIEKMYENVGIKKLLYCDICKAQEFALGLCAETECEPFYPPFTAEKQIELIKLLAKNDNIYITYYPFDNTYTIRYCVLGFFDGSITGDKEVTNVNFKEALAGTINAIWQSLTEEQKQHVKGILE